MINKWIKVAGEWIEEHLRILCGKISPDKRVILILIMFFLFTCLSLYCTFSSIYRIGKGTGERLRIQHIENLHKDLQENESNSDSIKQIKHFDYER